MKQFLLLLFVFIATLLTASAQDLIYIGANAEADMLPSDSLAVKTLQNSGYVVTYVEDNTVEAGYDYSGFDAAIYGESCSSSKVVSFGTIDNYPVPCVMMEPLAVRDDKWGWVTDREAHFIEDRDGNPGWDSIMILDNTHAISSDFAADTVLRWSTSPTPAYIFGYDLAAYIDGAIAIAKHPTSDAIFPFFWAIPQGTEVLTDVVLKHHMVILGLHAMGQADDDDGSANFGDIYATADVMTLLVNSVEWVLESEIPYDAVLYVGAAGADEVLPSDSVTMAELEAAGYTMYYMDDNDVAADGFDYSPFKAAVFGESCSSSRVVPFGKRDDYPIPCVMLEPLAVRTDKWQWIDAEDFVEQNPAFTGWDQLKITNNQHYITAEYEADEVITWSTAPEIARAYSFNLNKHTMDAVPLGINQSTDIASHCLWAIEAGSDINDSVTVGERLVMFGNIADGGVAGDDDGAEDWGTIYATEDYFSLVTRSLDWALGAVWYPENTILYVGAKGPDEILPSDSANVARLKAAGHPVHYVDDNDVVTGDFDYSYFVAVVFGESCSSSRVVPFGTVDEYPIPCVMMEPLAVRDDKWGWVTDRENHFIEDRDGLTGWDKIKITDNQHYITAEFDQDEEFVWSTSPTPAYAFGYDVGTYIPAAVPLAKHPVATVTFDFLWALDEGTVINDTVTLGDRLVVLGLHAMGLADDDDGSGTFGDNYATEDFYTLLLRSVDWALGANWYPDNAVLYVGAKGADEILPSDSANMAKLEETGYPVFYVDDNDVVTGDFDYSYFVAVVFGESCSSSRVVPFGTVDEYPIPCVMMEPLAVRDDKWGWVTDRENHFIEDRDGLTGWDKIKITDNQHYITDGYDVGQELTWSTATSPAYAFGYDVGTYIPAAVPLAKHPVATVTFDFLWALDEGTVINDTVTLGDRLVVLGLHAMGLADDDDGSGTFGDNYATSDFDTLLVRSFKWVLGATWIPGAVNERHLNRFNVDLYPNPAADFATLRFTLTRPEEVSVRILNLAGQTVKIIEAGTMPEGLNEVRIDTRELSGSLLLYRLEVGSGTCIGKFSIIR